MSLKDPDLKRVRYFFNNDSDSKISSVKSTVIECEEEEVGENNFDCLLP